MEPSNTPAGSQPEAINQIARLLVEHAEDTVSDETLARE